jgi:hypothetical protein
VPSARSNASPPTRLSQAPATWSIITVQRGRAESAYTPSNTLHLSSTPLTRALRTALLPKGYFSPATPTLGNTFIAIGVHELIADSAYAATTVGTFPSLNPSDVSGGVFWGLSSECLRLLLPLIPVPSATLSSFPRSCTLTPPPSFLCPLYFHRLRPFPLPILFAPSSHLHPTLASRLPLHLRPIHVVLIAAPMFPPLHSLPTHPPFVSTSLSPVSSSPPREDAEPWTRPSILSTTFTSQYHY